MLYKFRKYQSLTRTQATARQHKSLDFSHNSLDPSPHIFQRTSMTSSITYPSYL